MQYELGPHVIVFKIFGNANPIDWPISRPIWNTVERPPAHLPLCHPCLSLNLLALPSPPMPLRTRCAVGIHPKRAGGRGASFRAGATRARGCRGAARRKARQPASVRSPVFAFPCSCPCIPRFRSSHSIFYNGRICRLRGQVREAGTKGDYQEQQR